MSETTQTPFTVATVAAPTQPAHQSLRKVVADSVKNYLNQLDGEPVELYELVLSEIEHPLLEQVMVRTRGNQTRAAIWLGINRGTLRKKLKKYNMD